MSSSKQTKKQAQRNTALKWASAIIGTLALTLVACAWYLIFKPNVVASDKAQYFYVKRSANYQNVAEALAEHPAIKNPKNLIWILEQKNYPKHVIPGKYWLKPGMNNNDIANMLRSGKQEEVKLLIPSLRDFESLAQLLSTELEASKQEWLRAFENKDLHQKYGFSASRFINLIIPNTYKLYWAVEPEEFIQRMAKEYKRFWTEKRKQQAAQLKLSQSEVQILASIVQKESYLPFEHRRIAGVYYNRLQKGMRLQADPTLIYAAKDEKITRVLNKHKRIDSPYNTYKYSGLPPGPICIPEITIIDAVLNLEKHNYLYFCAREDFSGYHNFASNYNTHLANARRYQNALNKRKIYR